MPTTIYQRTAMAAAIAACFPAGVYAAGVARVDFAAGNVSAVGADGRSRALTRGSEVAVGETVSTQAGRAQLRFADGAYMSLQPQTEFKIEEFRYAQNEASDGVVMNLLKGGMRTITGLIGRNNRTAYRLKTDVATIGIRGTEYSVRYTNSIEVHVTDGIISVDNQSGSFTIPGGSTVLVNNEQTPPQQTDQKPVLPPESPAQKQQEEQLTKPRDPVNAIGEEQSGAGTLPTPQMGGMLTGTLDAHWAISFTWDGVFRNSDFLFGNQVTLDPSGALISFSDVVEGPTTITQSTDPAYSVSHGNDGIIAWGRWVGPTSGSFFGSLNLASPFEGPMHYIVGIPATNIPASGTATYDMMGSSNSWSGGPVSVTSSHFTLNFATSSGAWHAQFNVNGTPIGTDPGGIALFRGAQHISATGSLGFCGPSIVALGFLAGNGATRAGMAYEFFYISDYVNGVIAYQRTSLTP
jgi:hypothetical protein